MCVADVELGLYSGPHEGAARVLTMSVSSATKVHADVGGLGTRVGTKPEAFPQMWVKGAVWLLHLEPFKKTHREGTLDD